MRMFVGIVVAVMLLGAGTAQAAYIPATWEDPITDFGGFGCAVGDAGGAALIDPGNPCSYQHDITDGPDGFALFPTDVVTEYSLWLNLFDDQDRGWEWALVDMPGLLGDRTFFSLTGTEYGGMSIAGFLELNALGTLSVTVESLLGDFYLGGSMLRASGIKSVPEPATLALFGLGLIAVGLGRRRRAC